MDIEHVKTDFIKMSLRLRLVPYVSFAGVKEFTEFRHVPAIAQTEAFYFSALTVVYSNKY